MATYRFLPLLLLLHLLTPTTPFYLPGIAPINYDKGTPLQIMANKLTSPKNQLPYDYYSLDMCGSDNPLNKKSKPVNLGQVLMGERMKPTEYKLRMGESMDCEVLCVREWDKRMVRKVRKRIHEQYSVRLNLDNMPVIVKGTTNTGVSAFQLGYPLGKYEEIGKGKEKTFYIYNHLRFTILYHDVERKDVSGGIGDFGKLGVDEKGMRVVGFEAETYSVKHVSEGGKIVGNTCPVGGGGDKQQVKVGEKIVFSYDVQYVPSPMRWATRWDSLLQANPESKQIQWFSIINSLMISLFLTALVGTVLLRTVLRDFVRYNQLEEEDDVDEVTGWKLVHGDVFRTPKVPALLAVSCGTGAQLLWMTMITLAFALVGLLSPANRGSLLTAMSSLWVLASGVNGYSSARLYGSLEGPQSRKLVTLGSAFLFPGSAFAIFFVLNLFIWASRSQGAVPFFTLLLLLFMWFGISMPLVFVGAYIGYKRKPYSWPCRTNQIPRQIPPPGLIPKSVYVVLAGILPFGTIFMELVFILNSIWQNQVYYMFGFLFMVFMILVVTCAELSIVFTYLTLCNEDWKWWWQAFFTSGSSGIYMFAYSIFYLVTQESFKDMPFVSLALYLGYMLVSSVAFALMCGTVGFYSSLLFTRKIFASVRVD
eukprot:Plantae.Rhodophyta-Hildenbrandia_rubra.ctg6534.p1 GENE.Plantae.Rhodophyta-Hildenbrandia_rubra.ctg6534~~Plantae.Rhodophyta-Hildenbrandia_rubra.ctg6534.p1  ORF type:complete len:648 (-),score=80.01 Plantae.Rhodophyta-Hildenbrandia_rubra.ctg6534:3726-5669(-)